MAATLATLATLVGGRLIGNGAVEILGAATLLDAGQGDITLVDKNEKAEQLAASHARAAVVPCGFRTELLTMPAIEAKDVHRAFTTIVLHLRPPRTERRIGLSPLAHISPTARVATDVDVHPGASVGDDVEIGPGSTIHAGVQVMAGCRLAERVTLFPNVVLYENTRVGAGTIIHSGAVLGSHGFGYRQDEGQHQPSAQLGNVEIGAGVEIGACTTIDRGTYGPTKVGDGTKIDNLVMIAHNCRIGRHNMICSQVGIAGSTSTGDYVVMAGQVGVRDHVHIGDGAVLAAMAGITNDVPAGARMLGAPATPEREQKLRLATIAKLPEMRKKLNQLERSLAELAPVSNLRESGRCLKQHPPTQIDLPMPLKPAATGPKIGLIAGWGRYPLVVAQALRSQGFETYCLGIKDHADESIRGMVSDFDWVGLARLGRAIRYFRRHGVRQATMAGKVHKVELYQPWMWLKHTPDWGGLKAFYPHFVLAHKDRKDDTLLGVIVEAFRRSGVQFGPATDYAPELLVKFGCLTERRPTAAQQKDIQFGWRMAKELGRLDVGQSVAVKDRAALAVEAIEGTDQCIRRAGALCTAGGFTVVKVAKPQQDMRFDVPTIGQGTLESMVAAGAKVLAVEAGKTILIDEPQAIEFANRHHLVVVALDAATASSEIAAAG